MVQYPLSPALSPFQGAREKDLGGDEGGKVVWQPSDLFNDLTCSTIVVVREGATSETGTCEHVRSRLEKYGK